MLECLTLATTGSIQEYIFRSNRLAEIVGASAAVTQALEECENWPGASRIFVGGGNAAMRFPTEATARAAVFQWSRQWLEKAPGLRLVAAHKPLDADIRLVFDELARTGLPRAEDAPPFGAMLGALPVVRDCQSTGMGANVHYSGQWLSAEAFAKRSKFRKRAWRQLRHIEKRELLKLRAKKYAYPLELDHLGTREGASQIALVVADGNDVGKLFQKIAEDDKLSGVQFENEIGALSNAVAELAKASLCTMLRDLLDALPALRTSGTVQLPHSTADHRLYLPLRPIIFGGDDMVFVCHGKLGIALAIRYLRAFRELSRRWLRPYIKYQDRNRDYWTTCAGVLIMPQKFPFARGYGLAKELLKNAKNARREHLNANRPDACWLDFQVVLEGAAGALEFTRESTYRDLTGASLHRRPYSLDGGDGEHDFERFEWLSEVFRTWPRNKAKGLLESLARGRQAVSETAAAIRAAGIDTPDMISDQRLNCSREQWRAEGIRWPEFLRTRVTLEGCWDALEALDFHIPWPDNAGTPET